MPKKGLTDEEKEKQFEAWKLTPEYQMAEQFREERNKFKLEIALTDVPFPMQKFLDLLYELMQVFKVPRKAKQYEQKFVRTMYFLRLEEDTTIIDGVTYKVSAESNVNNFTCRDNLFQVYYLFDDSTFDMRVNQDDYQGWKKDLQKSCKTWDGSY